MLIRLSERIIMQPILSLILKNDSNKNRISPEMMISRKKDCDRSSVLIMEI